MDVDAAVRCLVDLGRYDEARRRLSAHLATQPGDGEALAWLAYVLLQLDDPSSAMEAARAAVRAGAVDAWPHRLLARAHIALDLPRAAVRHAEEAVRRAPDDANSHLVLSAALRAAGRWRAARAAAEVAVRLDPFDPATHLELSLASAGKRTGPEADAALAEALKLAPNDAHLLGFRAVHEASAGRFARAVAATVDAFRADPGSASAQHAVAGLAYLLAVRLALVTLPALLAVWVLADLDGTRWWRVGIATAHAVGLGVLARRVVLSVPAGIRAQLVRCGDLLDAWGWVVLAWAAATVALVLVVAVLPLSASAPVLTAYFLVFVVLRCAAAMGWLAAGERHVSRAVRRRRER